MVLGFKKQFVDKIRSGTKIHTIREDTKNRWKQGNRIHFATGVRTKNYDCFMHDSCYSVQYIKIKWRGDDMTRVQIWINDKLLNLDEKIKLAKNDGFSCLAEFLLWFRDDFEGKIIHWTDYRY